MPDLDHFGILAPFYDRIISYKEDEELLEWIGLPFSGNLLDIGGGTGRIASSIVNKVGNLVIVDISVGMLKIAKKKGFNTTCAFGEVLPYPDESFERALIVDALHHCSNQQGVIDDVWRVLKPGGLLIIVEPNYDHVSGKLIRIFEKLLFMRSKFLSDNSTISLFLNYSEDIRLKHVRGNSWFKVKKEIKP